MAHADSLRSEVNDDELVAHIKDDYRAADVDTATRAVLDFAVKLTRSPGDMVPADLEGLRSEGYDDRAIHDIVQVVSYFN